MSAGQSNTKEIGTRYITLSSLLKLQLSSVERATQLIFIKWTARK
jgi:hypothetical protein